MAQNTNQIIMVKPANFGFNNETSNSNSFQNNVSQDCDSIQNKVISEFDSMVEILRSEGVDVTIWNDSKKPKNPDAIFPNNWISMHAEGLLIIYPMNALNRRLEKRKEFIQTITNNYKVQKIINLSSYELQNKFLEGTGSIIFDHINKIAYACISPRTNKELFEEVCQAIKYSSISFNAFDEEGKEIYHTNVMMFIGNSITTICLESIKDKKERQLVKKALKSNNFRIIDINYSQMKAFCGNLLEIEIPNKKNIIAMSRSAKNAFTENQLKQIELFHKPVEIEINTIERIGGGSVRCMILENYLSKN